MNSEEADVLDEGDHIVVTGATGYLGSALVECVLERGGRVTTLGRTGAAESAELRSYSWQFGDPVPKEALLGKDGWKKPAAVIHLAHDWSVGVSEDRTPNSAGTTDLLRATQDAGIGRFVFASSISARPGALNHYGKTKWQIERSIAASPIALIARIGLIYGGEGRGQWGALCSLVARWPILLPMVDPHRRVQPIDLSEVCDGLIRLAVLNTPRRQVYTLGASDPISFGAFLRRLAWRRYRRPLVVVPVPSVIILPMIRTVNRLTGRTVVDPERVLGLAGIEESKSADSLVELGMRLRPTDDLFRTEAPDPLKTEARIMLTAVMGHRPSADSIEAYSEAIRRYANGRAVPLYPWQRSSTLLRLSEPIVSDRLHPDMRDTIAGRLDTALYVAEAGEVAPRVYDYEGARRWRVVLRLLVAILREVLVFPGRLVWGRIKR